MPKGNHTELYERVASLEATEELVRERTEARMDKIESCVGDVKTAVGSIKLEIAAADLPALKKDMGSVKRWMLLTSGGLAVLVILLRLAPTLISAAKGATP